MTRQQQQVVNLILAIGQKRGVGKKRIKAALETGAVESNFRNLPGGDADSQGWRQERASIYKNPTNLRASINRFYDETLKVNAPRAGDIAAAVQRPAAQYRGRYQQNSGLANSLLAGKGISGGSAGLPATSRSWNEPTFDSAAFQADKRKAILGGMIAKHNPNSILLKSGLLSTELPDRAAYEGERRVTKHIPGVPGTQGMTDGGGRVKGGYKITGPNPGRIKPDVKSFLSELSGIYGKTIVASDGTGHSKMTTSGNVSEHYTGQATDIPAAGATLTRMGQDALIAAGWSEKKARATHGGLFNVMRGGKRYQIIFNTNEGGNHFNHLHVGVH